MENSRRESKKTPAMPLPEALPGDAGKGWTIEEEMFSPRCDISEKRLYVPLECDEESVFLKAHELGHAKWSPDITTIDKTGTTLDIIRAVEDARINRLLRRSGVDTSYSSDEQAERALRGALKRENPVAEAALLTISTLWTGNYGTMKHSLAKACDKGTLGNVGDELCLKELREKMKIMHDEYQALIVAIGKLKKRLI